jgi:DNA repair exonuclease SbcCD ATPase subunit
MRAEQEIRHQSYDTLKTAIEVTQERVLGLKLSLAVTRGTPSETATQAMLEQHQRTLAEYKQELKELEELDVKRGESDAKSSARHEKAIAELETQYDSLESQRDELVKQHEQLTESLGWQIYREYEQATSKLQQKIEEVDAQRRGQEHAYRYAQAELRQEALNDLRPWPHVVWRIESLQRGIDAQRVDERHEKIPLVALLRAHQAFLRALQQHGRACAQRRYGNYDLAQVLSLSPQVVADALLKPIDFKPNIETDNSIIEQHT